MATGGEDKMIYFWNSKTGTLDGSIENVFTIKALQFAGNGNIFDVQFSPDGNHMISCGADESKQDYAAREIEANKFLNDLYDQYYIEYLEMLKQLPLGGDQPNTDYRILIT